MEGKICGISLSILGIVGLMWALLYISGPKDAANLPLLLAAGICGTLAFFTGIWLFDHKRPAKSIAEVGPAEAGGVSKSAGRHRPNGDGRHEHSTIAA